MAKKIYILLIVMIGFVVTPASARVHVSQTAEHTSCHSNSPSKDHHGDSSSAKEHCNHCPQAVCHCPITTASTPILSNENSGNSLIKIDKKSIFPATSESIVSGVNKIWQPPKIG